MAGAKSAVTASDNLLAHLGRQSPGGHGFPKRAPRRVSKTETSWCAPLSTYKVERKIQSGEYSMDGGPEGGAHEGSVAKVNGNRNVAYLDRNDTKRNLNLNWWSNRWNRNCRFLAVRHSSPFLPPYPAGVFV